MFISSAFAQTAPAAAAGGDMMSSLTGMLPLVLMFVVLYFVMIRPQMKKQKEHRAMIDALAKGDEVATAGGLLGKVTKLGDAYLTLELLQALKCSCSAAPSSRSCPRARSARPSKSSRPCEASRGFSVYRGCCGLMRAPLLFICPPGTALS